ncbi:hypothetical protein ACOY7K_08965 [Enterobacter asburiae]
MRKFFIIIITFLTLNTHVFASTFTCYDPNDYQRMEIVNSTTGTALFLQINDTILYRHGTGENGESIYVDEGAERKVYIKWIDNNLTFIKLLYLNKLKVILSCKEYNSK